MRTIIFFILSVFVLECQAQKTVDKEQIFIHVNKPTFQNGEILWFRLYTLNARSLRPIDISKLAYVEILDAQNRSQLQGKVGLRNGQGDGSFLLPENLRSGGYTIRAYTNWMKNFGAATFARQTVNVINPSDFANSKIVELSPGDTGQVADPTRFAITVAPDKDQYQLRDAVTLKVNSADLSGKALAADLSISVYRLDSLTPLNAGDMLAQFRRTTIPDNPEFKYAPELHGHIVTGTVVDRQRNPVSRKEAYLAIPGRHSRFYCGFSDSSGQVRFEIKDFTNADRLLVQTDYFSDSTLRVNLSDPFSHEYIDSLPTANMELKQFPETILEQSLSAGVQGAYHGDTLNDTRTMQADSVPFYGKPTMTYALDNYVRFPRMEDVFVEYVRPVVVRRRSNLPHLFVFFENENDFFTGDPLVLLDGIPVFQIQKLFRYDPLKVERIDVLQRKYYRGMSVFDGVVDLHTYRSVPEGYEPDVNASVVPYEGLQSQRLFYSPNYMTAQQRLSRLPDYRTVLFWSPSVQTNSAGANAVQFFTSDLPGTYEVVVHGITTDGRVASGSAIIRVGPPAQN